MLLTAMKTPADVLHRALRGLALTSLLALAACGPGTGGTGTGPVTFASAGMATTVPCGASCRTIGLLLDTERVELTATCLRFAYAGPWDIDRSGTTLVTGTLERSAAGRTGTTQEAATLQLQFSEGRIDSPQVTLLMRDAADQAVLGPVSLQQGPAPAAPPACEGQP